MATGRVPTTANSPLTAKGDLFGYSTTQARVPVGSDGEQIVADSSTSTGLRYQGNYAAGKNKILNGDFNIWQRGTTSSANGFLADRFNGSFGAATTFSQSRQTFTPGTAPVAGYEGKYFWRGNVTNAGAETAFYLNTYIEDVQTLAGQTATISFWAKADSARSVGAYFFQQFGTGGSTAVNTQIGSNVTLSTSWQRFSLTINAPSIAGKTIGTGSHLQIFFAATMATGFTFDIWGVQLEAGSVATAFQTATGTIQGELAACQRYFQVIGGNNANESMGMGLVYSTTQAVTPLNWQVPFRATPTVSIGTGGAVGDFGIVNATGTVLTVTGISTFNQSINSARTILTVASGLVAGNATNFVSSNSNGRYFISAEL